MHACEEQRAPTTHTHPGVLTHLLFLYAHTAIKTHTHTHTRAYEHELTRMNVVCVHTTNNDQNAFVFHIWQSVCYDAWFRTSMKSKTVLQFHSATEEANGFFLFSRRICFSFVRWQKELLIEIIIRWCVFVVSLCYCCSNYSNYCVSESSRPPKRTNTKWNLLFLMNNFGAFDWRFLCVPMPCIIN